MNHSRPSGSRELLTTATAVASLLATLFGALRGDVVLALAAVGAMLVVIGWGVVRSILSRVDDVQNLSLTTRLESLTETLAEASNVVREIERELASRRTLVQELEEDAEKFEEAVRINESGYKALKEMLEAELQASERRTWRATVEQGAVFFVLGVAASATIALLAS